MDTKEIVRSFILKNLLGLNGEVELEDEIDIFKVGFVNSLFSITLIQFLESKFNISIDTSELDIENFNNVNNIVSFINKKNSELGK